MTPPPLALQLANAIHDTPLSAVPGTTVAGAKRLLLDTLAVALAGNHAPGVGEIHRLMLADGGAGASTVWGFGTRLPASAAALVNACAGAALDYDSLNRSVHADSVVLAAALATAEQQGSGGADFVRAFILGSELVCRLAHAARGEQRGWSQSSVNGVFGAAAACALLLRLSPAGIADALGIALSLAGGTQQSNVEQVLTKRLQPALAARHGVFAAAAAAAGISAPREVFEGRFGFWALYQPGSPDELLLDFGRRFVIDETGLKKYPVCACSHAAIESCLALVREHDLAPDAVESVEAIISPFMDRLVGGEFDPARDPQVTAQFSLRYALASVLLRRRLGLAELESAAVRDPGIAAIASRVRLTVDTANREELAPATVILRLCAGTSLSRTTGTMPGSSDAPLDEAEFDNKLAECARHGLRTMSPGRQQALRAAIERLDAAPDLRELVALL